MTITSFIQDFLMKKKLKNITLDTCSANNFDNQLRYARVISIYDGDTITCAVALDGVIRQYKVRMYGYDSPEMKPSLKNPNREAEKVAAVAAKEYLAGLIMGKIIVIKFEPPSFDKYGRLLVTVYYQQPEVNQCFWILSLFQTKESYIKNATNINEHMVNQGHGVYYDGGTKSTFEQNYPTS